MLFTLPLACSKVRATSPMLSVPPCSSDLLRESIVSTLCLAIWEILPSSQNREPISWQKSPHLSRHYRPLPYRAPRSCLSQLSSVPPLLSGAFHLPPTLWCVVIPWGKSVMLLGLRVWEFPQHWPLSSPSGTGDLYFTPGIFQLSKALECHYAWTTPAPKQ